MSKASDAISVASGELGKPYSYGAEGPGAFDCSGLIQYVYNHVGISLPRTAAAQQAATTPTAKPKPGDLVFYGTPAHHVGLYLGAGRMIAAPHTGAKVQIQAVYGTPSNYGRVKGSGAAATAVAGITAGTTALNATDLGFNTGAIVDGFREIGIKLAFIAFGLTLVGVGVYRSVGKRPGGVQSLVKGLAP